MTNLLTAAVNNHISFVSSIHLKAPPINGWRTTKMKKSNSFALPLGVTLAAATVLRTVK